VAVKVTKACLEINALARIVKTVRIDRTIAFRLKNVDAALKIASALSVVSRGIVAKAAPASLTRIRTSRIPEVARRRPETCIEVRNALVREFSQPEPLETTVETTLTAVSTRLTMILDPKVSLRGPTSDEKTTRAPCQYRPGAGAYPRDR
jgi:hypothetical protein